MTWRITRSSGSLITGSYFRLRITFVRWLGVNATTFNVAWIFSVSRSFSFSEKWILPPGAMRYLLAVIPSSLSYFAWPLFIGRTVFIAAWLVIPLAAYGLVRWQGIRRACSFR